MELQIQHIPFTSDTLKSKLGGNLTPELVDKINDIATNSDIADTFKDTLLSYAHVLGSHMSVADYVNAVTFNSYLLQGYTKRKAWGLLFPDRMQRLLDLQKSGKEIAGHVASYSRSKAVVRVMEQTLVPAYIYNAAYFQEALNTQVTLMRDDTISPKVRSDAAESVMKYTQMPEDLVANKTEVAKEGKSLLEKLAESTLLMAQNQAKLIDEGRATPKTIAGSVIYEQS